MGHAVQQGVVTLQVRVALSVCVGMRVFVCVCVSLCVCMCVCARCVFGAFYESEAEVRVVVVTSATSLASSTPAHFSPVPTQ